MVAVSKQGIALRHAAEELRDDREVVMAAVAQTGSALQFAGKNCDRTDQLQNPEI